MKLLTVGVSALAISALGLLSLLAAPANADPYISPGDSSSTTGTYVSNLYNGFDDFPGYDESLGADEHVSLAQGGAGLGGLVAAQLPVALNEINAVDDTKAVTVGIGGNEGLGGCFTPNSECGTFRSTYRDMLSQLQTALASDPGDEPLLVLAYFNPKNELPQEADFDQRLLGTNLIADQCAVPGSTAGLNDVIFQVASELGVQVGDAYPAFKVNGQAYIGGDEIHPNAAGNFAIAEAFLDPVAPADCPDLPEPTCATDPSLCPDPEPNCETDASLCPPDLIAPQTSISKSPPKISRKRTATFRFRSSENGSSFRCSIDRRRFTGCRSPKTYRKLKPGRHVFRVQAVDSSGNVDTTPAIRRFRIKR